MSCVLASPGAGRLGVSGRVPVEIVHGNAGLLLLEENLEEVPSGAKCDLYVIGECLARGYLNSPAVTASAFIPGDEAPGARTSGMGDAARRLDSVELLDGETDS
jgi:non-ribosomal peptide synthetase component F